MADPDPVDFSSDPAWADGTLVSPTPENLRRLRRWLRENRARTARMYHGTDAALPVPSQGLLPTSARRRRSLGSSTGRVSLSIYPGMARAFGELANPGRPIAVYAVDVPVSELRPDADQLRNKRLWGEDPSIGRDLASSIAHGHGAQVRGRIEPWRIRHVGGSPAAAPGPEEGSDPRDVPPRGWAGRTVFHGTSAESARSIREDGIDMARCEGGYFGNGFYCAAERRLAAQNYAGMAEGGGGEVVAVRIGAGARVLDLRDPGDCDRWIAATRGLHLGDPGFAARMRRAGIDGVYDNSMQGVAIFNPSACEVLGQGLPGARGPGGRDCPEAAAPTRGR